MGGQLQRYKDNSALECAEFPADGEPAIPSRVARLAEDMKQFAEEPRPVVILDEDGKPLKAGDHDRRFSKLHGCINTTGSTISLIPQEIRIFCVMPSVITHTVRLFTRG